MLGDFITRGLVMVLGYAYPAFECFKTVEKNKVEIEELRFWCQYWILVAALTVFERIGDIFLSWLPMYGEMKLGLFIYLWYPKTKGTSYVYGTFLRPYIAKHEEDIDRKLQELRARVWDMVFNYWQHCAIKGQASFFQILGYLAAQSAKIPTKETAAAAKSTTGGDDDDDDNDTQKKKQDDQKKSTTTHGGGRPTHVVSSSSSSFKNGGLKHRPPLHQNGELAAAEAAVPSESVGESEGGDSELLAARNRLRRSKGIQA